MSSKPLSLSLALALTIALPFAGCSKSEPAPSSSPTQQAAAPATAATAATAEPPSAAPAGAKAEAKPAGKRQGKKEARAAAKKEGRKGAKMGDGADAMASLGLRVQRELLQKLGADSLHVNVQSDGGKLVLSGEVTKRETAELAEEVARTVEGVASVDNKIKVGQVESAVAEAQHELSDASLETEVQIALVGRMGSDGLRIDTDAASGVVTLSFPKKMKEARRKDALELAKQVQGVAKVVALDKK